MVTFFWCKKWLCVLIVTGVTVCSCLQVKAEDIYQDSAVHYQESSEFVPKRKDPFIAGVLSWFMMGTGQIYVHEYSKGSLFIAADLVDKGAFIGLIAYINNKYSPKDDEIINVGWKDLESGDKALIISYFVAKFGLKFFSVYDAVKSTQKYNERLFDRNENRGVSLTFNQKALNLEYTVQFSD